VIIKLGGSVITNKSKPVGSFRKSVVARLAREIKQAKSKKNFDLIIIHGAGSFGHPIVKKFKLNEGFLGHKSAEGYVLCRESMSRLKILLLQTFLSVGLAADIVDTSDIAQTHKGKIVKLDFRKIKGLLKLGIIPLISGDVVFDSEKIITILSGDTIAPYIAGKLGAKKIIYVSDVDGVYDKNPQKYSDARLVREINSKNYKQVLTYFEGSGRADVTGEMEGKIKNNVFNSKGTKVKILNGLKSNMLHSSLMGERVGTSFQF